MSEQAQKVASEAVFFLSNGAIWGNFLLKMEISHRILPFQKRVLPFDHFAKKKGRLLKSSDFCGDKISPFWYQKKSPKLATWSRESLGGERKQSYM
jgi:hypothetical protein